MALNVIDPRSIGAFVEYTLKPLIDEANTLLESMERSNLPAKDIAKIALRIFIVDKVLTFITQVTVTGMICFTLLHFLATKQ